MDRKVRALIIALLCVLAVSLASATLVDPESPSGGGFGGGADSQSGTDEQGGQQDDPQEGASQPRGGSPIQLGGACIPFLTSPTFFLLALVTVVLVAWGLKRRDSLVYAFAVVGPLVLFFIPIWAVLTDCGTSPQQPRSGEVLPEVNQTTPGGDLGGDVGGGAASQVLSPPVLLGLIVVAAVLLAALAYRSSGDDTVEEDEQPVMEQHEPEDEEALAAVGAAAGEAADRIEGSAELGNEVFRAWREMTGHVDVGDPATSTPAEFATAAREAGMDSAHVETLTGLFRDVRYGGVEATAAREERAVDALRAIEDEYADRGGDEHVGGEE